MQARLSYEAFLVLGLRLITGISANLSGLPSDGVR